MIRHVVAGVAFETDFALPELDRNGFADLDVRVSFDVTRPAGRHLKGPDGVTASMTANGAIHLPTDDARSMAWSLRQIAPVVAAAHRRLTLHGSSVGTTGGSLIFVGESGSGKSTLAGHLAGAGFARASDDLTPIRFTPMPTSPIGADLVPVAAVCFLSRGHGIELESLSDAEALREEIRNGFGEHGEPDLWEYQFDAYHGLVSKVDHYRLGIPDDIDQLPAVAEFLRDAFSDHLGTRP